MEKIFSRKRIHLPKISFNCLPNKKQDLRKQRLIKIIFILIIALGVMAIIINAIDPIINTLCLEASKEKATLISNKQATEVMKSYTYEDLMTIYRDSNNNVTMLKSNIASINEIISDIALRIQEEFAKDNESTIN